MPSRSTKHPSFSHSLAETPPRYHTRSSIRGGLSAYEERERRRKQALFRKLEAAEPEPITVLIGPMGSWAHRCPRYELLDTFEIEVVAWRKEDGRICYNPLRLVRPSSEGEVRSSMKTCTPGKVIRVAARLLRPAKNKPTHALLEKLLSSRVRDQELQAEWHRLCKPVRYRDPTLGVFTLDRQLDWWKGRLRWDGKSVQTHASAASLETLGHAMATGRRLLRGQKKWNAQVLSGAAKHLLSLANEWAAEGADDIGAPTPVPISRTHFLSRLKLKSISLDDKGRFEFSYDDGDLFWGHDVVVKGDIAHGIQEATIEG